MLLMDFVYNREIYPEIENIFSSKNVSDQKDQFYVMDLF